MAVLWTIDGFQLRRAIFGRKLFLREISTGKKFYPSIAAQSRYLEVSSEILRRRWPEADERLVAEHAARGFIAAVTDPNSVAGHLFHNLPTLTYVTDALHLSGAQAALSINASDRFSQGLDAHVRASTDFHEVYSDNDVVLAYNGGADMLRAQSLRSGRCAVATEHEKETHRSLVACVKNDIKEDPWGAPEMRLVHRTVCRALLSDRDQALPQFVFSQVPDLVYATIKSSGV